MKKVLSIALAVGLFLSMAAMASAFDMGDHHPVITKGEVKISGDARVRGLARTNYDFNNEDASDDIRIWDNRFRLVIDVKSPGGTLITTRLQMTNGYWGDTTGEANTSPYSDSNEGNPYFAIADWFYMSVPMGPATLTIGRQTADWGNKFLVWDARRDRAKLTAKFGTTTVGVLTDKLTDTLNTSDGNANLRDKDDWAVLAIHQMGDWKVGTIWIYIEDNRRAASGVATVDARGGDSQKQYVGDVFFNGKAGGFAIEGEAAYKNNVGRLADVGGFVQASFAAGPASIRIVGAHADGGYLADDDFIPLNLIGLDNPWAVMNFGGVPSGTSADNRASGASNAGVHNEGKSQTLVGAAAAVKLSDLYTVAVDGGYLFDDLANAWTASAAFVWQINADTNWTLLAGYWDGDSKDDYWSNNTKFSGGTDNGIYKEGDAYWVVGHKLEVKY